MIYMISRFYNSECAWCNSNFVPIVCQLGLCGTVNMVTPLVNREASKCLLLVSLKLQCSINEVNIVYTDCMWIYWLCHRRNAILVPVCLL